MTESEKPTKRNVLGLDIKEVEIRKDFWTDWISMKYYGKDKTGYTWVVIVTKSAFVFNEKKKNHSHTMTVFIVIVIHGCSKSNVTNLILTLLLLLLLISCHASFVIICQFEKVIHKNYIARFEWVSL